MSYKKELDFLQSNKTINVPMAFDVKLKDMDFDTASTISKLTEEKLSFILNGKVHSVHFVACADVTYEDEDLILNTTSLKVGENPNDLMSTEMSEIRTRVSETNIMVKDKYSISDDNPVIDLALHLREEIVRHDNYTPAWGIRGREQWDGNEITQTKQSEMLFDSPDIGYHSFEVCLDLEMNDKELIAALSEYIEDQHPGISVEKLLKLKDVIEKSGAQKDGFVNILSKFSNEIQDNIVYFGLSKSEMELQQFIVRNHRPSFVRDRNVTPEVAF